MFRGTKYVIRDFYKESKEKIRARNQENVSPNKNLVGKKTVQVDNNKTLLVGSVPMKTPASNLENVSPKKNLVGKKTIQVDNNKTLLAEPVPIKFEETVGSNAISEVGRQSSSFDLLLNSLLTPSLTNHNSNNTQSSTQNVNSRSDELSFEEFMTNILTPERADLNRTNKDHVMLKESSKEKSVQSSFDQILTQLFSPNSSQISGGVIHKENSKCKNIRSSQQLINIDNRELVSDIYSQNWTPVGESSHNFSSCTTTIIDELAKQNTQESTPCIKICEQSPQIKKVEHILDILSQDVTISSYSLKTTKFRFNKINKVGTEKWLQSAFNFLRKNGIRKKCKIVHIYNDYGNINIENSTKQYIKRYREGATKIYKIKKLGMRTQSNSSSSTCDESESDTSTNSRELSVVEHKLRSGIHKMCTNQDLLCSDNSQVEVDKNKIKNMIHDLFVKLYDALENDEVPCFQLRNNVYKNCVFEDGRLRLKPAKESSMKKVNFNSLLSRFKFCLMLYVMGKVYTLLENDNKITKREMFYQIKDLLKNQNQLNYAIHEVTCLLNIGQWHLNLIAYSGLVYGDLKLVWSSGEVLNCNVPATMIPYNLENIVEVQSNACFILVVEKESIFHKLIEENLPNKLARPFIIMSGKGMPDLNTQVFLNKLSKMMAVPVLILVDADVYGIKIMLSYRFGSLKSCHLSDYLAVPNARWLGVFPSEISKFGIKHSKVTDREKRILKNLIKSPHMQNQPKILEELNLLWSTEKKAPIEGLIKNNTFLSESYLPTKLFKQDFI